MTVFAQYFADITNEIRIVLGGFEMKIQVEHKVNFIHANVTVMKNQEMQQQKQEQPKDSISIGVQARQLFGSHNKKSSLIESLMKQRENILEQKNKLTERALDKGNDLSSLKEQMKALEKQISDIDAQIAQEQKGKLENKTPESKESAPKTTEESIFSKADSLEQTKTLSRMGRTLSREKVSLESEMKIDAKRGVHSEYKSNRLEKLKEQMTNVQGSLAESVKQTTATTENVTNTETENEDELNVQEQIILNAAD